jgi:radical SAM superfamily enzyme YgiQ (UPF0313 family)
MKKAKVLLIGAEDEENLALRYLAAVLEKEEHKVRIVPCSQYKDFTNVLKIVSREKPDIIGISIAFQSLARMYFDLIEKIRESKYRGHITVGGHFPTFEYKKILETQNGIDSVIRFEGEQPIVELANSIVNNSELSKVHNLVYRVKKGIRENKCILEFQDFEKLPFPKREKKPQMRLGEKFATLIGSRGCWHSSCLYCCIGAFHSQKIGRKFFLRNQENVAEEIAELYRKYGVRLFQFHDDNFMLPTKKETVERLKSLKKAIETKNINTNEIAFLIKARPDTIDDKVASVLKELGVVGVFLGIENASESGLRALIRRTTLKDIHQAMSSLKKFDIVATFNLLIFHPTATLDEIDENIKFMKNNINYPFDFGRAEVVAGSPLERMLVNKKKLIGSWPNWNYTIDDDIVDKMFRINLKTFRRKESPYSELMHHSIALAYHAYTLKRLHDGPIANELASESMNLITEINKFIVDKIEKMRNLTVNSSIDEDTEKLYDELSMNCKNYFPRMNVLTGKMMRLSVTERVFQSFGVKDTVQQFEIFRSLFSF